MEVEFRAFDPALDTEALRRIWNETRWIDATDEHRSGLDAFLSGGAAEVATLDGVAECLTHRTPGRMFHLRTPLPLVAITGVTTSHLGRRRRLASTLVARALRKGARNGAAMSALGMFERGFYDRFGFGTGSPEMLLSFDPGSLQLDHVPPRTPERLTLDDAAEMSRCMARRLPHHGLVVLDAPRVMEAEMAWTDHAFALGYRTEGRLSHFLMGSLKEENGPFVVNTMSFETGAQLLELLRLLYDFSDQVHSVRLIEPPEVQIHQLLREPDRQRNRSIRGDHETVNRAATWWQARVLDVPAVVAALRWPGDPVEFTMDVADPVSAHLDPDDGWDGVGGRYRVVVGAESVAQPTRSAGPSDLRCSVNALTRLLFGVRPASSLALTDDFQADESLLARLDEAIRLPPPQPSLSF